MCFAPRAQKRVSRQGTEAESSGGSGSAEALLDGPEEQHWREAEGKSHRLPRTHQAGDEEEEMARILSNADRMNAELVQRGLKTIIRRSTAIEIDTMVGNWSFIAVGALPFYQGLVKAGETDMLRRNPKLSAWFFVPPLHDDSLAVTDALIELLRNEGVVVKREILQ